MSKKKNQGERPERLKDLAALASLLPEGPAAATKDTTAAAQEEQSTVDLQPRLFGRSDRPERSERPGGRPPRPQRPTNQNEGRAASPGDAAAQQDVETAAAAAGLEKHTYYVDGHLSRQRVSNLTQEVETWEGGQMVVEVEDLYGFCAFSVEGPAEMFSDRDFRYWLLSECRATEGPIPAEFVEQRRQEAERQSEAERREEAVRQVARLQRLGGVELAELTAAEQDLLKGGWLFYVKGDEVYREGVVPCLLGNGARVYLNAFWLPFDPSQGNRYMRILGVGLMSMAVEFLWPMLDGQWLEVVVEGTTAIRMRLWQAETLQVSEPDQQEDEAALRILARQSVTVTATVYLTQPPVFVGVTTPREVVFGYPLGDQIIFKSISPENLLELQRKETLLLAPFDQLQLIERSEEQVAVGNVPNARVIHYKITLPAAFPYSIYLKEERFVDGIERIGAPEGWAWKKMSEEFRPLFISPIQNPEPWAITLEDVRGYLGTLGPKQEAFASSSTKHSTSVDLARRIFQWKFPHQFHGRLDWSETGFADEGSRPTRRFPYAPEVQLLLRLLLGEHLTYMNSGGGISLLALLKAHPELTPPRPLSPLVEGRATTAPAVIPASAVSAALELYYQQLQRASWPGHNAGSFILALGRTEDSHDADGRVVFLIHGEQEQKIRLEYPVGYRGILRIYHELLAQDLFQERPSRRGQLEWYANPAAPRIPGPLVTYAEEPVFHLPGGRGERLAIRVWSSAGTVPLILDTDNEVKQGAVQVKVKVQAEGERTRHLLFAVVTPEDGARMRMYHDPYAHRLPAALAPRHQSESLTFELHHGQVLYALEREPLGGDHQRFTYRTLAAYAFDRASASWRRVPEEDMVPFFLFRVRGEGRERTWDLLRTQQAANWDDDVLVAQYQRIASRNAHIVAAGQDTYGNVIFLVLRGTQLMRLWYPQNYRRVRQAFLAFCQQGEVQRLEATRYVDAWYAPKDELLQRVMVIEAENIPNLRFGSWIMPEAVYTDLEFTDEHGANRATLSAQKCQEGSMEVTIQTSRDTDVLFAVVGPYARIDSWVDDGNFPPNVRRVYREALGTQGIVFRTTLRVFPGDSIRVLSPIAPSEAQEGGGMLFRSLAALRLHIGKEAREEEIEVLWQEIDAGRIFCLRQDKSVWRQLPLPAVPRAA